MEIGKGFSPAGGDFQTVETVVGGAYTALTKRLLQVGTALALIHVAPAFAQASGAETPTDVGDIIVTARRVEERLQDVPISITVYTPVQIANRNISNSADLATYTPSLTINSRFGPEKASFVLRGFSQDALTAPSVAVYFADVVAPRLQSNTAAGNGAGVGSLMDLQNIQVLKGPQGTLFGRNTTGGAILIVPQKPTSKFEGYIEGTLGNYNARRIQGVVNVPVTDDVRMRLAIDSNKRDGYLKNRYDLGGVGPATFNDLDYIALRLSVVADLTPDIENYAIGTYSYTHTNGTLGRVGLCNRNGSSSAFGGLTPIRAAECAALDARAAAGAGYYDVTNSIANPFERQRQLQFINTTTWSATDTLTIKNIVSYSKVTEFSASNIEGDAIATPFVQTFPGPGGNKPQGHQRSFTEELQFQGRMFEDRLNWQAGGYMETSTPIGQQEQWTALYGSCTDIYAFRCTLVQGAAASTGSVSIARNNYRFHDYGIYAQATYKIMDQLSLTAGVRYTWDRESSESHNFTVKALGGTPVLNGITTAAQINCTGPAINPTDPTVKLNIPTNGSCGLFYSIKSRKPTWTIDFDYKPTNDILLYAKYSRGYRAGGINPAVIGAATWEPEKIDTYEAGIKTTLHGPIRGTINIDGFYNNFENQQVSVFIPNCSAATSPTTCTAPAPVGINGIQNAGKSKIKGVEADVSLELFKGFRAEISYAYLDAKITSVGAPASCATASYNCAAASGPTVGTALFFSPKNRVTMTGTYMLPLDASIGKVSAGATFTHTDSQRFSYADQPAFLAGAIPYDPSLLPANNLLNLNLNWDNVAGKPIDVALFATNVTKTKYWVASTNGLTSTGAEFILLGQPRMMGVRAKFHFGN